MEASHPIQPIQDRLERFGHGAAVIEMVDEQNSAGYSKLFSVAKMFMTFHDPKIMQIRGVLTSLKRRFKYNLQFGIFPSYSEITG